ncbi:RNA polymerase II subunit B1 CTD phosphatase [Canna indica]|uniref:RNA polymerase II subunit B1 CTD phosphatase RPAP2 homolog n=1 Tax=Canna indica TaxID=4628 RepID=A0AAQ3QAH1_9LILI|nr:RNA polymerase II subunit B1 CTD phosphatase [Canna indica]
MAALTKIATIADAVHRIQHALLDGVSCSERQLFAAAAILSRADYEDVVVELSIANLCGYPLCRKPLPSDRQRRGRYRISLKEHTVYDLEETYKYCSEACVVSSRAFAATLGAERRSDVSDSKIEWILDLFRRPQSSEADLVKDGDLGIRNLAICEKDDAGKGEVSLDEWMGPSNAIEGYVPKHHGSHGAHEQNRKTTELKYSIPSELDFKSEIILNNEDAGLAYSTIGTLDASEAIAKKLEEVVLEERKENKTKVASEDKFKTRRNLEKGKKAEVEVKTSKATVGESSAAAQNSPELDFTGNLHVRDQDSKASSTAIKKPLPGESDNGVHVENKSRPKEYVHRTEKVSMENKSVLRSSLKNSRSKNARRSVSWADEKKNLAHKERKNDLKISKAPQESPIEDDSSLRLASAEARPAAIAEVVEPVLKSSLKTCCSRNASQSVGWADEKENLAHEEIKNDLKRSEGTQESQVEDDSSLRLASAKACAAALAEAAEAVSSGISGAENAASEAGLVILPQPEVVKDADIEEDEDTFEVDRGYVKWPKKTVLLDTDMFEVEDSWHDTPPDGFKLELSSFATMWMALFGWITCSSLAYIYGCDESFQEDFLVVNGREYPHKIVLRDGQSSEIRRTIDGCVCRALPGLVMELRLPVPVSTLEKTLGRLLDTMSFVEALPSFKLRQWQVIVILFLDALSVHRLPSLTPHVMEMDKLLHKVLNAAKVSQDEYETMRDLIIPLGRSSDVAK